MIRSTALLSCVVGIVLSPAVSGAENSAPAAADANAVKKVIPPHFDLAANQFVIFITGNTLSEIRPCGCSGGQLGGFDRRASVIAAVDPNRRLVLDTGSLIEKPDEQSLLKFDTIMQAFAACGYDVVNLTAADAAIAKNKDFIDNMPFTFIGSQAAGQGLPPAFSKTLMTDALGVVVLAQETLSQNGSLPADGKGRVKIVILDESYSPQMDTNPLIEADTVVVVRAQDTDTPKLLKRTKSGGLIVTAGRKGKYVGMLTITAPAESGAPLQFDYREIPIVETLPQDTTVLALYKEYQAAVKEAKLLEKYPRFPTKDKLKYIGTKTCGRTGCHEQQYAKWLSYKHSHAHQTLADVGYDYDPECQRCHSVGMEYQGGFVSPEKTPEFKNVGCEDCHGPGSKHLVRSKTVKMPWPKPQDRCKTCHTLEQGPKIFGREQEYLDKIKHWREPNAPVNVKK